MTATRVWIQREWPDTKQTKNTRLFQTKLGTVHSLYSKTISAIPTNHPPFPPFTQKATFSDRQATAVTTPKHRYSTLGRASSIHRTAWRALSSEWRMEVPALRAHVYERFFPKSSMLRRAIRFAAWLLPVFDVGPDHTGTLESVLTSWRMDCGVEKRLLMRVVGRRGRLEHVSCGLARVLRGKDDVTFRGLHTV